MTIRDIVTAVDTRAGRLLREARKRAGLSQVELALRAGITQSVVSAYESGRRQPSLPTLMDLVRATGMDLVLEVAVPDHRLDRLTGPLGRRVVERRDRLKVAAAEHGLSHLRVFGSVARGQDGPDSDVDLLADLPEDMSLIGLGTAERALSEVLEAPVDLIPERSLKPSVRERVLRDVVPL